ncbi:MAG TPA: phosphatase PAP2 family protein, partial [Thermoguttaceae bacterium]|nr:phosphatase PAP2 family protein [Thermoguttaceae bacterium]
ASFWRTCGVGEICIPVYAGLAFAGAVFEDRPLINCFGTFGGNVTRGYLVGAPSLLLMQFTLGASRPGETSVGSQWKPFTDDNAVSGHAFIGAVPFLTAAGMTDNPWLKGGLYVCSTFTGWSRINDHYHYLSQVGLGWWMAYLSCRAVQQTNGDEENLTFAPLVTPDMVGGCVMMRR